MAKDAVALIDALGGRREVAARTGIKVGAIDLWKHRNRVPRTAWPEIQKAYPDVTLDQLLEAEAAAPLNPRAGVAAEPTGACL